MAAMKQDEIIPTKVIFSPFEYHILLLLSFLICIDKINCSS